MFVELESAFGPYKFLIRPDQVEYVFLEPTVSRERHINYDKMKATIYMKSGNTIIVDQKPEILISLFEQRLNND